MRRVIFCPDESYLKEAEFLAKTSNLPINVGDFEELKYLLHNKTSIQVLEIPENKILNYEKNVLNNFHQNIYYTNDFIVFDKNCYLSINGCRHKPILIEKHKIIFNIYETQAGLKDCVIINNNEILESFIYNAY